MQVVEQRSVSTLEGPVRLRARGFEVVTRAEVSWEFTQADYNAFVSWFEIDLGAGRRRFVMPIFGDGGTRVRLCRAVSSMKATPITGGVGWAVSVSLEFTESARSA